MFDTRSWFIFAVRLPGDACLPPSDLEGILERVEAERFSDDRFGLVGSAARARAPFNGPAAECPHELFTMSWIDN